MTMDQSATTSAAQQPARARGFTLVEVLMAAAIMGILFVALMEALRTGLQMLEQSQRTTIASVLAEEVYQMTLALPLADPQDPTHWGVETGELPPFDDVDDYDGMVFSPPRNTDGNVIAGMEDYEQQVTVVSVSEADLNQVVADGASDIARVTVTVTCRDTEMCRMSWLAVGQP